LGITDPSLHPGSNTFYTTRLQSLDNQLTEIPCLSVNWHDVLRGEHSIAILPVGWIHEELVRDNEEFFIRGNGPWPL
jgi:hypothetical protein